MLDTPDAQMNRVVRRLMDPTCDRCGRTDQATIMSLFNCDVICLDCKADEKLAPGYAGAADEERRAVMAGVRNYPGVGLSADDRAFLAARREERKAKQEAP